MRGEEVIRHARRASIGLRSRRFYFQGDCLRLWVASDVARSGMTVPIFTEGLWCWNFRGARDMDFHES